jgi:hypothetical protein
MKAVTAVLLLLVGSAAAQPFRLTHIREITATDEHYYRAFLANYGHDTLLITTEPCSNPKHRVANEHGVLFHGPDVSGHDFHESHNKLVFDDGTSCKLVLAQTL